MGRMKRTFSLVARLAPTLLLSACMVVPDPVSTPPAAEETAVGLGQPVTVGQLTVTPLKVVEDSRCPINARCVWAGRLIVSTRIEGMAAEGAWRDHANITLGETYGTHGTMVALVSGEPGRITDRETRAEDYRFVYQRRDDRMGGPPPRP